MVKLNIDNPSLDAEVITKFWRYRSNTLSNRWTNLLMLDYEVNQMSKILEDYSCPKILDLGSGSGDLSRRLLKSDSQMTAVDQENNFGKSFFGDSRIDFVNSSIQDFNSEERFDLILLFGVVTHLEIPVEESSYSKIKELLNSNGVAVIKNQCSDGDSFIFNGYSEELGMKYVARYPNKIEQLNRLSKVFSKVSVVEYPNEFKKHPNSTHVMFLCRQYSQ